MRIFLLTAVLCCVTVHSRREVLLDLSKMVVNDDEGLGWTTLSLVDPDDEGWAYETYPVKDVNAHALSACNVMLDRVDSWVLTPRVHWGEARRMHIEVQFSIRDCKDFPGSTKTCKETFGLYVRQTHPGQPNATRDNFREEEWDPLSRLTPQTPSPGPKMPAEGTEVRSVDVQPGATGVEFAFRDQGACISLLQIKIYYEVCGASVVSLASFPQTVAAGEYTKREGVCVRDALAKGKPMAACRSDGRWDVVYDACQCNKGFSPDSTMHQCVGCGPGHFKSSEGNGACTACPMNSQSTNTGATECTCLAGYYRAAGEAVTKACTQPPSKPSNVRVRNVQQSSAVVEWDEPSSLGGRSEMWYEWQCPRCESRVKATPADRRLSGRLVRLDGLEPDHVYTVMLTAHNHVSERVGDAAEYGLIEFRTAPLTAHQVGPVQVHAVHKDAVTVAWQPPARARGRTVEYEVEVRANGGRAMLRATEQTQHTEMGIQQGAVYEFRVRANVEGWGEWSSPLQYRAGGAAEAAVSRPSWQSSAVGDLPAWVLAVATLLLILLLAFAAMICRRSTRNRKQMSDLDVLDTYKQDTMTPDYNSAHRQFVGPIGGAMSNATKLSAPLIPAYGSPQAAYSQHRFKPYVDPTAYEDPNQALSEFTYDLDPAAVYITSVIGGGEFGDVCLGGLHRSSGGQMEPPETVAIKTLKPGSGAKARADFLLEASIMGQFAHPNVIRLIGVVTRNEPVMIVTEYMANGSLDNYLRSKDARGEEMVVGRQLDMLRGVAAGMKYLTDKGFVHRDLAARNVLVDCELNCKIADFGLSRGVDNTAEQEYTTNGGKIPVRWTAPEAITHRKFTASSDVWSYGVLMWEVCSCGERPYWDWTNQTVIAEIMKGYRLPAPMDTPVALHRLMLWCWRLERHERPSFGQLLAIVEKYCRQPELVHIDTGSNPRSAHSSTSVSLGNGTPPPPVGCPPVAPPLDEFLRQLGLSHCWDRLHREGIDTVQRLARLSHLDALAVGLISDEWQRVRDGIAQLAARHRRRDDGFFV